MKVQGSSLKPPSPHLNLASVGPSAVDDPRMLCTLLLFHLRCFFRAPELGILAPSGGTVSVCRASKCLLTTYSSAPTGSQDRSCCAAEVAHMEGISFSWFWHPRFRARHNDACPSLPRWAPPLASSSACPMRSTGYCPGLTRLRSASVLSPRDGSRGQLEHKDSSDLEAEGGDMGSNNTYGLLNLLPQSDI